jgi:uncharacterized phiE125 gp8 family phage protein
MPLRLITAPATEPVSRTEAKAHLRVTASTDDTYIDALITASRQRAEQVLNRALISQTWELVLEEWPDIGRQVEIPVAGVTSVTTAKYYDGTNTLQTWSSSLYEVALSGVLAKLGPVWGQSWPMLYERMEAVEIRFVAGYANAAAVPAAIKQWMLLQIGHWYEHRESASDFQVFVTPFVDGLLDPYRAPVVG